MKIVKPLLVLITLTCSLAMAQATNRYLVILQSFQKLTIAQAAEIEQQMNTLGGQGFSPYLIQTDDYPPLRKGLWAVVLGQFDKQTAKAKQQRVQTWVKDAYIKTVKPPVAKQEKYGFSTLKTSYAENNCITIDRRENEEGATDQLCPGVNGKRLYLYIGDIGNQFEINQLRYEGGFMPAPEGERPLGLSTNYPLTWIYRDGALAALSGVFISSHPDTGTFNDYRLLINMGKKQLCPVKKLFEKDDINAVLTYLNDNPSNCPYRNTN